MVDTGGRHVTEVAWSPDSSLLAPLARPPPEVEAGRRTWIGVVPAGGGEAKVVCRAMAHGLAWTSVRPRGRGAGG